MKSILDRFGAHLRYPSTTRSDGVRAWPPFIVSSSDWDDLRRPRYLLWVVFRDMPSAGASSEVEVISGELAQSGVSSVVFGIPSPGWCIVRRQFFGLGRSTAAQIPLMSCLPRHAVGRGVKWSSSDLRRARAIWVFISHFRVRTSTGWCTVRRQLFGLGRSTAAQLPLMSCLSSHANSRGTRWSWTDIRWACAISGLIGHFRIRTLDGVMHRLSSVLRIGRVFGGPDASHELFFEPCKVPRHQATWRRSLVSSRDLGSRLGAGFSAGFQPPCSTLYRSYITLWLCNSSCGSAGGVGASVRTRSRALN